MAENSGTTDLTNPVTLSISEKWNSNDLRSTKVKIKKTDALQLPSSIVFPKTWLVAGLLARHLEHARCSLMQHWFWKPHYSQRLKHFLWEWVCVTCQLLKNALVMLLPSLLVARKEHYKSFYYLNQQVRAEVLLCTGTVTAEARISRALWYSER